MTSISEPQTNIINNEPLVKGSNINEPGTDSRNSAAPEELERDAMTEANQKEMKATDPEDEDVDVKQKNLASDAPAPPVFICHEATYVPNNILVSKKPKFLESCADNEELLLDDDDFYPQAQKNRNHTYPKFSLEEHSPKPRPAVMSTHSHVVKQIVNLAHSELSKHGCQRLVPEKSKPETKNGPQLGHISHHKKRISHLKMPHETMERKLNRLKIYRRAFGSLIIHFTAYAPLLFHIKKAYEDVLSFRLKQFKDAQYEKIRLHHERVSIEHKMISYRFPDFKRLKKSEQYLNLLYIRIRKQDEAIQFITEILTKMERSLSDHYEKYRDMEDQIKMLDIELTELTHRSMIPKKFEVPEAEENKDEDEVPAFIKAMDEESEDDEQPIDENEEIDEDKRMVLILAYAVCMKDLEEAHRKLKLYEKKYQLQQLKKKLRQGNNKQQETEADDLEDQEVQEELDLDENSEDEGEEEMSDEEEEDDEDEEEDVDEELVEGQEV